jgi:hypothetical protein
MSQQGGRDKGIEHRCEVFVHGSPLDGSGLNKNLPSSKPWCYFGQRLQPKNPKMGMNFADAMKMVFNINLNINID